MFDWVLNTSLWQALVKFLYVSALESNLRNEEVAL